MLKNIILLGSVFIVLTTYMITSINIKEWSSFELMTLLLIPIGIYLMILCNKKKRKRVYTSYNQQFINENKCSLLILFGCIVFLQVLYYFGFIGNI